MSEAHASRSTASLPAMTLICIPEVDLFGGQHRDAAMAVLGIVPAELNDRQNVLAWP